MRAREVGQTGRTEERRQGKREGTRTCRGLVRTAMAVAIGVAAVGPPRAQAGDGSYGAAAAGEPVAPPEEGVWRAVDLLDGGGTWASGAGLCVEVEGVARQSVDDELESVVRVARQPAARGLGVGVSWGRVWDAGAALADEISLRVLARGGAARASVGAGALRAGRATATRALLDVHVRLASPLVAGAQAALYPGQAMPAARWRGSVHGALDRWRFGIRLGPEVGELDVALGLQVTEKLAWTAAYAGMAPSFGVVLRGERLEVRAEHAPHPLLGGVARVMLRIGGER